MKEDNFLIKATIRRPFPRAPYRTIKNKILGEKYVLSLVFVGNKASKKLNTIYRGKERPTNVLSFPIDKNAGEIFIDTAKARSETKKFETTFEKHVIRLFIHGLLHLKGLEHGSTMEKQEKKFCQEFGA